MKIAMCFLIIGVAITVAQCVQANPKVKHCINHMTQEVIAVPANQPCPYPMVEL